MDGPLQQVQHGTKIFAKYESYQRLMIYTFRDSVITQVITTVHKDIYNPFGFNWPFNFVVLL